MQPSVPLESDEIVTVKDVVKALFRECGGHKRVMDRLQVGPSRVYGFTDPSIDEQISFARVVQLTDANATALAGGVFFPLNLRTNETPMALIGASARSHGGAVAESLKSLADGVIDGSEKRTIIEEIDKAIADLASLRGALVAMADPE